MNEMAELFGGIENFLVMKEFVDNPRELMTVRMVADVTGADGRAVRSAIAMLARAGLVIEASSRATNGPKLKRSSIDRDDRNWRLNTNAPYLKALENLLKPSATITNNNIYERFNKIHKLQMLILAGQFQEGNTNNSSIDILIVADKFDEEKVNSIIEEFEQEIGTELSYVLMSTDEYEYRKEIRDKTLRELFAGPHKIIVNKLGRI